MGNAQNTTTAKQSGARRSVQAIIAAILLSVTAFPANGQGAILNNFQRELLELERETKGFDSASVDFLGIQGKRVVGALRQAELDEIKDTAETLLPLARELKSEALDLIGANLYAAAEPGTEIDAEVLYRLSANELQMYFARWEFFLRKIVISGEATSPFDFWTPPDDEGWIQARIYRQLANIQYRLEQLEVE